MRQREIMAGEGSAVVMTLVPDTLRKFSASHDCSVIPKERTPSTCDWNGEGSAETESGGRLFVLKANKDTEVRIVTVRQPRKCAQ